MYTGLLHAHNGLRWIVLIFLVLAFLSSLKGWFSKGKWKKQNNLTGLGLVVFMDIQFLIGIILYAGVSPITKAAFQNFGAAMKNPELRFYVVEHILIMLVALVLVHLGRIKSKRILIDWKKHRAVAIYYGISLLLILIAIPWDRALY